MLTLRASLRVAAVSIGVFALSLLSCGREITAPRDGVSFVRRGLFSVDPQFPRLMKSASLTGAVEFERVRIVLRRADGTIALDTMVLFPVGSDSVALAVTVPLAASTGAAGENLQLSLGYINAAGDTVFKGGPVAVTVVPQGAGGTPPPPVAIPVVYSGAGSTAASVVIAPRTFSGYPGDRFGFTAAVRDPQGSPLPSTPVIWATSDGSRVILDSNLGSAGTLAGARGTARLYAQTLTGQIDSVTLTVLSRPQRLELVSGDNQTSAPARTLPAPLVVRVVAEDGQPTAGVVVTFGTTEGTVAPATATSDAAGLASTRWTLGTTTGQSTMTATAAGLTGAAAVVTFNAQTVQPRATTLAFENEPATAMAGAILPSLRVVAKDSTGMVVPSAAGTVTLALSGGAVDARLGGTTSAPFVNGIATFADLTVNRTGTGYTLVATALALTSANSALFTVTEGPAAGLRFSTEQGNGVAGRALGAMRVQALDAHGNPALAFSGAVTLRINVNPGGGTLGGTLTRNAVAGVTTFDDVTINRSGSGYTLAATAEGLATGGTIPFDITSGAAGVLLVVRGANQSAPAGSVLDTIIVQLTDSLGNPVAGAGVAASAAAGNGTVTVLTAVTDAFGQARLRWTLGATAGGQQMTIGASGLTAIVSATAVGSFGPMKLFLGFDNLNITTGVPTALSVFITAAQASPLTVTLTTLDTLSQWTTGSVVIPAGATSATASILGRAAGSSLAVASAPGAGADTVSLTVNQATIRLLNSYMYLNAGGDTIETRVELSAPAPVGGLTVSFDLSIDGVVHIVPSPGTRVTGGGGGCDLTAPDETAVAASRRTANVLSGTTVTIKAGETQAYIYVVSDTAGSTDITPIAAGYGSQGAEANVSNRDLYFYGGGNSSNDTTHVGVSQAVEPWVSRNNYGQASQAVTVTALTPGVVQVPAVVVIRAGSSSQSFKVVGTAIGSTLVVVAAPGFKPDTITFVVHQPTLIACCSAYARAGTVAGSHYVSLGDGAGSVSGRPATPLTVSLTSRNPAVTVPVDATITIQPGDYSATWQYLPLSAGNTWMVLSAPGYASDSVPVTVDGAGEYASWSGYSHVGAGQYTSARLYSGARFPKAFNFSVTSSNPAVVAVDSTAYRPALTYYSEYFRVVGLTPGTATITWSAPGFRTDSLLFTVSSPNLGHTNPCCLVVGGNSKSYSIVTRDTINVAFPVIDNLTVSITSRDTSVVKPTSPTATIYRGSYSTTLYAQPMGAGTTWLIFSAPGYPLDSVSVTVSAAVVGPSAISISSSVLTVGKRQTTSFSAYRSGATPAVRVSIAKRGASTAVSDTAFDVSASNTYVGGLTVSGLNPGVDTLIFTAPGHVSDTVVVKVTTPKLVLYSLPGTVLANYPYAYLQFYLADSSGNSHPSMDTLRFSVTPSDSSVGRTSGTSWEILPGSYSIYKYLQFRGPGTVRFRIQDPGGLYATDSTNSVTVLQPELHISPYYDPLFVGMRQRTDNDEMYVYTDYNVLVPTWVRLQRSTAALVTMPDSVLIPAGNSYAYFTLAGLDTVGGLQVQASSPGFASATKDVVVSRPAFNLYTDYGYTGQSNRYVEVRTIETGGNYTRSVTADLSVTLTADSIGVAGVDSSTVTIPAGSNYSEAARLIINGPGTSSVTASDARGIYQRYLPATRFGTIYQSYLNPVNQRYRIGVGQRASIYVTRNFYADADVPLTITGTGGHTNRTGTTVDTISQGYYYAYISIEGTSAGTDTLVLSVPRATNGRAVVEVSEGILSVSGLPASMKVGDVVGLSVSLRTPDNAYAESVGTTTLSLSAANAQWGSGGVPDTTVVVTDGAYNVSPIIKATTVGTATFTISAPGYLTKSFTVQVLP